MDPKIWGRHGWIFLHSITMAYPDKPTEIDKQNFKTFFHMLSAVLPCDVCGKNLRQHMAEIPIENALSTKRELVEWLINIHNKTNITLGKPKKTYEDVIKLYKQMYSNFSTKNPEILETFVEKESNWTQVSIILGIIIISIFIWNKRSVLFV